MYPETADTVKEGDVELPLNQKNRSRELCMAHPSQYNYTTDLFADRALHWLETQASGGDKPFFAYVSFTVPHAGGWGTQPQNPEQGQPGKWKKVQNLVTKMKS